jgi:hypothetical protein
VAGGAYCAFFALLAVSACASDVERYEEVTLRVTAGKPGPPVGSWHGQDGIEDLRVFASPNGLSLRLRLPTEKQYRLARAEVIDGTVHVWVTGPEFEVQGELRQVEGSFWQLSTVERVRHGYALFKDPTPEWLAARSMDRTRGRVENKVEDFVDWLVRAL